MMVRTEALWSALPLPALHINAGGRISAANPAAEAFLNRSQKALLGSAFADHAGGGQRLSAALRRVIDGRAPLTVHDLTLRPPGRGELRFRAELSPLDGDDGTPATLLLLLPPADEARDKGHGAAPGPAARSAIGLADMLAHEIKNPLAGITGAAQLLSMSLGESGQELTDMIVSETKRISRLLERVEQFGNPLSPDSRPFNLHDVLDRARQSALLGLAPNVPIPEEYDPSLPEAIGDPDQLLQVFLNLLKNAAEAVGNTKGGTIRIRSRYDHGLRVQDDLGRMRPAPLCVDIIDNGPGVPPDIAGALFTPFVSGRENGVGLGLALVNRIVSGHGGQVAVESRPGHTVFTVSLPAAPGKTGKSAWTEPY